MAKTKKTSDNQLNIRYLGNSCIEGYAMGKHMSSNVQLIKDILRKENSSMNRCPFGEEKAINLDDFENSNAKKRGTSQSCTVDCVVGLETNYLLMVEMKFKVKTVNMNNIAKNVRKKEMSSRAMLGGWLEYTCLGKMIVLLGDEKFESQKNSLYKALGMNRKFEILKVSDFYQKYFVSSQIRAML